MWPTWARFERALPELGDAVLLRAAGARAIIGTRAIRRARVLVFGCESVGLPPRSWRVAEESVASDARPELRSLNLSTSVAVAAYEVRRQWGE